MLDAATLARFRRMDPGMELVLTHRYRQPMEKVFAALSIPERIADWMGVEWQGDPAPLTVGSSFSYTFANTGMASLGRVTAYEPPRLIEHTWFENHPPAVSLRWSLEAAPNPDGGEGCILTLTQTMARLDDATRSGAGWTMIMGQLDAWLEGKPFSPAESWVQVRDRLVRELGPAAVRDGRRLTRDGRPVVEFVRLIPHAPEDVWPWLVEPGRLNDWLGDVEVEPHPGGAYRIRFTMAPVVMEGTVTAIDPPRHLALIWREPWFTGDDVLLEFALEPHAEGTLLTLTHTFPEGYDPQDYLAGWHEFLDAVEDAMAGAPFDWKAPGRKQRYETLETVYRAIAGAGGQG